MSTNTDHSDCVAINFIHEMDTRDVDDPLVMVASLEEDGEVPKQYLPVLVNGVECRGLVDSGNLWRTCINPEMMKAIGLERSDLRPLQRPVRVTTAKEGANLKVWGETKNFLHLSLGSSRTRFKFRPVVVERLAMPLNISARFLRKHHMDQLHSRNTIRVQNKEYPLFASRKGETKLAAMELIQPLHQPVWVKDSLIVPPNCSTWCTIAKDPYGKTHQDGVVDGSVLFMDQTDCHPCRNVLATMDHNEMKVPVANTTDEEILIPAGTPYGHFSPLAWEDQQAEHPWLLAFMRPADLTQKVKQAKPLESGVDEKGKVIHRNWMDGPTTLVNLDKRIELAMKAFGLNDNPLLKKAEDLAAFMSLILRNWETFSWDGQFGKTNMIVHEIHTTPGPPITQKVRPLAPAMEESLREQVAEWLKADVIQKSDSPWNCPLVPARKAGGRGWRWCLDFRALNQRTMKDSFPIGNCKTNLNRLCGSRIFSALDAAGAFHSVPLEKSSRPKTAFSTPDDHYEFKRLPFGLINGPATYARLIQKALQGIPTSQVLPYLDDLLIHSADVSSHLAAIERVVEAVGKGGIKLQPHKCQFFKEEAHYLGHVVSSRGIQPLPAQTEAIRTWEMPRTRTQLRAFLGKVGYYRSFIKDFSKIAKPLLDRLSKDDGLKDKEEYQPGPEMETAFKELKGRLMTAPILAYPDFSSDQPFIVDSDWSQTGASVGAVLSQKQDGKERVIAYMAKRLSDTQANYFPTKGELFAIMSAIKHWDYYLKSRPFLLRIDHQALTRIKTMDPPEGAIARWLQTISNYDFSVTYRPGPKHGNADGMSRKPNPGPPDETTSEELILGSLIALVGIDHHETLAPVETWKSASLADEEIQTLCKWIRTNHIPTRQELRSQGPLVQELGPHLHQLVVQHQLLKYQVQEGSRDTAVTVVPDELTRAVILKAHELLAHRSADCTLSHLRKRVFFPGMAARVREVLRTCNVCQTKTKPTNPTQRRYHQAKVVGYPWQNLYVDFVGPLPPSHAGRFQYLLTVRDGFTRWIEAFPCRNLTTEVVIKHLTHEVFSIGVLSSRFGYCEQIHSDQGSAFTSSLMNKVASHFGIRLTTTPPYNPSSNPVERAHRDLETALVALCKGRPSAWVDHLPAVLFSMRISECSATGFSPFRLVMGRDPICPLDLLHPLPDHLSTKPEDYADRVRQRQQQAFQHARRTQELVIQRRQRLYKGQIESMAVGDQVWVFVPRPTKKWAKLTINWTGPWTITQVINPVTYEVAFKDGRGQRLVKVPLDRIRPYYSNQRYPPTASIPADNSDLSVCRLPKLAESQGAEIESPFLGDNDNAYESVDTYDYENEDVPNVRNKFDNDVCDDDDGSHVSNYPGAGGSENDTYSEEHESDGSVLPESGSITLPGSPTTTPTPSPTFSDPSITPPSYPETLPLKPPLALRRLQPHLVSPDHPVPTGRTRSQTHANISQ